MVVQVVIHDNTYDANTFRLPLGIFSVVDRNGHTITLAFALALEEGTEDYVWQFSCYLKAVGIAMKVLFIDADPASTVAARRVFLDSHVAWCLWHIYKNLAKHVKSSMKGAEYQAFARNFANAQRQSIAYQASMLHAVLHYRM